MDDQASGTGRVTGGSVHIGTDLRTHCATSYALRHRTAKSLNSLVSRYRSARPSKKFASYLWIMQEDGIMDLRCNFGGNQLGFA